MARLKSDLLSFLGFAGALGLLIVAPLIIFQSCEYSFPKPNNDLHLHGAHFSEGRARLHIGNMSKEEHPAASPQLLSVAKYIKDQLQTYADQLSVHSVNRLEIDTQIVSGHWVDGRILAYTDVINIVARVSSWNSNHSHALLVGGHFDSAGGWSFGASDDGLATSTMLELARLLLVRPTELQHDVIFNFNGAEEPGLLAAHGFITQHPWARAVRAEINLEAMGGGGKELLFRSGPHNQWLTKLYADHVVHPYAHGAGQDIYSSGIITSGTDWTVYTKFGKIPALDIAYTWHGHVYHTRYDRLSEIQQGAIQHQGDNIIAVVNGIVDSGQLDPQVRKSKKILDKTDTVFYDVLGKWMVEYSMHAQTAISCIAIVTAAVLWIAYALVKCICKKHTEHRPHGHSILKCIALWVLLLATPPIAFLLAFLADLALAALLSAIAPNAYYIHDGLAWVLYGVTHVIASLLVHWVLSVILLRWFVTEEYAADVLACERCRASFFVYLSEKYMSSNTVQDTRYFKQSESKSLLFLRRRRVMQYVYAAACVWLAIMLLLFTLSSLRLAAIFLWCFSFAALAPFLGKFVEWLTGMAIACFRSPQNDDEPLLRSAALVDSTSASAPSLLSPPCGACMRFPALLNIFTTYLLGWVFPSACLCDIAWKLVNVMLPRMGKMPGHALTGEMVTAALVALSCFVFLLVVYGLFHLGYHWCKTLVVLCVVLVAAVIVAICVFPYAAHYPGRVNSYHVHLPQLSKAYIAVTADSPRTNAVYKSLPHIDAQRACDAPGPMFAMTQRGRCSKAGFEVHAPPIGVARHGVKVMGRHVEGNTHEVRVAVNANQSESWTLLVNAQDHKKSHLAHLTHYCIHGESPSAICNWEQQDKKQTFMLCHTGANRPNYFVNLRFDTHGNKPLPQLELWLSTTQRTPALTQHLSKLPPWASGYAKSDIPGPVIALTAWNLNPATA
eukprot:gnl/Trimastix_PCT/3797.p1 GENE.gnl/Trimastix_PCT/3797~~gnl/Trimastix_PCT/3797.p1  ORF type:complete len:954 (+),score=253.37 gnl/Trimastix_PCT/3797:66-2927(+)